MLMASPSRNRRGSRCAGEILVRNALLKVLAHGLAGRFRDVRGRFRSAVGGRERGAKKFVHVAFEKQDAHGELRRNKGIVSAH